MKKLVSLSAFLVFGTTACTTLYGEHGHGEVDMMNGTGMHEKMHQHMHGNGGHSMDSMPEHQMHSEESLAGKPGKKENVKRTIHITASDDMKFHTDAPLEFKEGETVEFVVANTGRVVHEFVIGTKDEHMEHGEMMMKMPNMHHVPGTNAVTLKPGETKTLIWQFDNAWQIEAACNVPGHYQAGMHNPIKVSE